MRMLIAFVVLLLGWPMYAAGEAGDPARGAKVYQKHCFHCHGAAGEGKDPFYPALRSLAGLREPEDIALSVLSGRFLRGGERAGHTIPIMPSWSWLTDRNIADLVNFITQTWGNGTLAITATQVAALRDAGSQDASEPLTDRQTAAARELYFEHCVGCHGVYGRGASGPR